MRQILLIFALLFAINCNPITKVQLDKFLKPFLEVPANYTFLVKNVRAPFPKYYYGIIDAQSYSNTINKFSPLTDQEKEAINYFFEDSEYGDSTQQAPSEIQVKDGFYYITKGMYLLSAGTEDDKKIFLVVKFDNLTYEPARQKLTTVRECRKSIFGKKCYNKIVSKPIPLTSYDQGSVFKGIRVYFLTQVYGDIVKNL